MKSALLQYRALRSMHLMLNDENIAYYLTINYCKHYCITKWHLLDSAWFQHINTNVKASLLRVCQHNNWPDKSGNNNASNALSIWIMLPIPSSQLHYQLLHMCDIMSSTLFAVGSSHCGTAIAIAADVLWHSLEILHSHLATPTHPWYLQLEHTLFCKFTIVHTFAQFCTYNRTRKGRWCTILEGSVDPCAI